MALGLPVSCHLDLYRYWDSKRGTRVIPRRDEIDPMEIRQLLPYIALIDLDEERYRWRLMGTAIVTDIGRDLTGKKFGEYVAPVGFVKAMITTFDEALSRRQAIFEDSLYEADAGTHAVSRLILPLARVDSAPGMLLISRITRMFFEVGGLRDHLMGADGILQGTYDVDSLSDLQRHVVEWEQRVHWPLSERSEFCGRAIERTRASRQRVV